VNGPAIPKRIIQTGKTRELTLKQRACTANMQLLNPDYEWCFFDNAEVERFVDAEFPQYRKLFDNFKYPIQRYDFFRYLAVYRLGGFYFDQDVLLAANLDPLLPRGCVFPFEGLAFSELLRSHGMDWEIGNYAFGAAAGHPFLEAVIANCVRSQEDPAWARAMMRGVPAFSRSEYRILYTTTQAPSRTLAETPALRPTVTVLFPYDVCDPETWNRFGEYGVHLMDGSWRAGMSWWRRRLAQRYEHWILGRRLREAREKGKSRLVPVHSR
jgi:mannosyltransferase OCH1-like enzyme